MRDYMSNLNMLHMDRNALVLMQNLLGMSGLSQSNANIGPTINAMTHGMDMSTPTAVQGTLGAHVSHSLSPPPFTNLNSPAGNPVGGGGGGSGSGGSGSGGGSGAGIGGANGSSA